MELIGAPSVNLFGFSEEQAFAEFSKMVPLGQPKFSYMIIKKAEHFNLAAMKVLADNQINYPVAIGVSQKR
jgi:hypothetical protein